MNSKRRYINRASVALCAAVLFLATVSSTFASGAGEKSAAGSESTYPVSTVTLLTHSSPGGGSDLFLRQMIKYLGPKMGVTFVVKNVTGGGGAKAMAELANSPADGSVFYATTPTCIQTPMFGKTEYTIHDLEPMVNVFQDPMLLYTRAASPLKDLKDVLAAAKQSPSSVKWGGGTATELGRQILEKLKEKSASDVRIISFEGGGDLMLSVLNGTVDLGVGEPGEISSQLEAGKVRLLAIFTDERLAGFPDTPTAKEQGVDLSLTKFRGLTGPKGLPPEVVRAWETAIPKLLADPAYKAAYSSDNLIPSFMNEPKFQAYVARTETDLKDYLTSMGVIK